MATVETNTVTLTINGREITVAKGRTLVEAASEAGIEIPVFCYEPRLGAGVGACRMCLCEIEGMPKLQTACTTPAADGMVVNSHSGRAKEGQDAVLEFLLLNHPLDCPVCDKGGECPLQDLTFRYGPGVTRMTLPKRTHEKPVPISPLIKLDRERCILCYRCTRFSEGVSGDMQLVPENRGANSIITTFEGRPYTNEFSGNVTELCPVGALTSTTYRFLARPWEIQNVPTTCGQCAVGCNTYATIREGRVARVLSRNHPERRRGLAVRQGPLRPRPPARSRPRHPEPDPRRARPRGRAHGRRARPRRRPAAGDRRAVRRPGRSRCWSPASRPTRRPMPGRGCSAEALGGGTSVCGPEGSAWLDDARAVCGVDLRPRRRARDRGRGRRRPRPPRAGARAVDPQGGAKRRRQRHHRRARRDPPGHAARRAHISAAPGTAHAALLTRPPRRRRACRRACGEGGAVLIWSGPMRAEVASVLAHVAHSRLLGAAHPRAANEIGCARRRPGHRDARARRSSWPSRGRSGRSCCWEPTRWVNGTPASAGGRARALLLRPAGDRLPERLVRLGDDDGARVGPAREGRDAHQPRGPRAARARSGQDAARRRRRLRLGGRAGRAARRRPAPRPARPRSPTWPSAGPPSPACRGRASASTAPLAERPAAQRRRPCRRWRRRPPRPSSSATAS